MAHRRSPEVDRELDDSWHYIATQSGSVEVAQCVIEGLISRFFLLAANPLMGRRRDEDLRVGLRSFPAGEYVIFYRMEGADAVTLHLLHGHRDLEALLRLS